VLSPAASHLCSPWAGPAGGQKNSPCTLMLQSCTGTPSAAAMAVSAAEATANPTHELHDFPWFSAAATSRTGPTWTPLVLLYT